MWIKAYKQQTAYQTLGHPAMQNNSTWPWPTGTGISGGYTMAPSAILVENGYVNTDFITHFIRNDFHNKFQVWIYGVGEQLYIDENPLELAKKKALKNKLAGEKE